MLRPGSGRVSGTCGERRHSRTPLFGSAPRRRATSTATPPTQLQGGPSGAGDAGPAPEAQLERASFPGKLRLPLSLTLRAGASLPSRAERDRESGHSEGPSGAWEPCRSELESVGCPPAPAPHEQRGTRGKACATPTSTSRLSWCLVDLPCPRSPWETSWDESVTGPTFVTCWLLIAPSWT